MERDYVNLTSRFYREKVLESVRGAWVALLVTFGQFDMRLAWVDLDIAFRLRRISWYPIYIGYETTSGGGFKSDFKIGFHIWYLHLDWFYQIGFLSGSDTDLIQATFRLDLAASVNGALESSGWLPNSTGKLCLKRPYIQTNCNRNVSNLICFIMFVMILNPLQALVLHEMY